MLYLIKMVTIDREFEPNRTHMKAKKVVFQRDDEEKNVLFLTQSSEHNFSES